MLLQYDNPDFIKNMIFLIFFRNRMKVKSPTVANPSVENYRAEILSFINMVMAEYNRDKGKNMGQPFNF